MKSFYRIRAQADPTVAEVQIDDFIGDWIDAAWGMGVNAKQFLVDLAALGPEVSTIQVRINSPGGDVTAAVAIANALRDQVAKGKTVCTIVDGMAASAATIVMVAGTPAKVADNAVVVIHNPWSIAQGDAATLRHEADTLDLFRDTIVATYQWKSPLDTKQLQKMMDAETWMNADEAIAAGLADEKVTGMQANAVLTSGAFASLKVPERFRERVAALLRPANVVPTDVSKETAPRDETWNALTLQDFTSNDWEALSDSEKKGIAGHFAWADEMPPKTFGDLKLGHHRATDGKVVFRGIAAAAARLDQTQGIDDAAVKAHLEAHYHAFNEKAPWEPVSSDETMPKKPEEPMPMMSAALLTVGAAVDAAFLAQEETVEACVAAGLGATFALDLMKQRLPLAKASEKIAAEASKNAAEKTRQDGIRALCAYYKQEDLVAGLIASGATIESTKTLVLSVKAKVDRVEIDAGLDPNGAHGARRVGPNAQEVYRELNKPRGSSR